MISFQDKRIIITGGTRGIGKAIALAFSDAGARVAVTYGSDADSAGRMADLLDERGPASLVIQADVSDEAAVAQMAARVTDAWGGVDVLVNNAGIIRDKLMMFLPPEDWDAVIRINLTGTYLCARAVIKAMIGNRFGRIINIVSPSGIMGRAGQTNYSAAKGGVIAFTKSLAREVAKIGVTVNAVCPGVIDTAMLQTLDAGVLDEFRSMIPLGRFGSVDEVAQTVLFVASDQAKYITGQTIAVDGGLTCG